MDARLPRRKAVIGVNEWAPRDRFGSPVVSGTRGDARGFRSGAVAVQGGAGGRAVASGNGGDGGVRLPLFLDRVFLGSSGRPLVPPADHSTHKRAPARLPAPLGPGAGTVTQVTFRRRRVRTTLCYKYYRNCVKY